LLNQHFERVLHGLGVCQLLEEVTGDLVVLKEDVLALWGVVWGCGVV
jgi:hypothetical protein